MFGIEKTKTAAPVKRPDPAFAPPIDVYESDAELLLIADVPGASENEAEVTLDGERLLIQAKGKERNFRRELSVPQIVDGERVSASLSAGVLTVHLPKRAQYQPRQIAVRGA